MIEELHGLIALNTSVLFDGEKIKIIKDKKKAKRKSQKEIKNLLELIESLNKIRDNLQDENRVLTKELETTKGQLEESLCIVQIILELDIMGNDNQGKMAMVCREFIKKLKNERGE